jgi:hypothetical protein
MGDARVGKSTISRLMLDLYREKNILLQAYYHGNVNKLETYQTDTFKIPLLDFSLDDSDIILDSLQDKESSVFRLVLTDMPGQNLPQFEEFEKKIALIDNLNSIGYHVTFLHPISYRPDCVKEYLKPLLDIYGSRADYVIVKNHYFGDEFRYYDGQPIQDIVKIFNGVELDLAQLHYNYYQKLYDTGLTYSQATTIDSPLNVLERSLIFHWIKRFHDEVMTNVKAVKYLGLSNLEEIEQQSVTTEQTRRVKW